MKLRSIKSLNDKGLAHYILPLLIVLAVAVVGTYFLVASHADSPSASKHVKTRTLKVAVYSVPQGCTKEGLALSAYTVCSKKPKTDKSASLFVTGLTPGAKCANRDVTTLQNFHGQRVLKCTPGKYIVSSSAPSKFQYNKPKSTTSIQYEDKAEVTITSKSKLIRLGSYNPASSLD